jgi:hypothetical protein
MPVYVRDSFDLAAHLFWILIIFQPRRCLILSGVLEPSTRINGA